MPFFIPVVISAVTMAAEAAASESAALLMTGSISAYPIFHD